MSHAVTCSNGGAEVSGGRGAAAGWATPSLPRVLLLLSWHLLLLEAGQSPQVEQVALVVVVHTVHVVAAPRLISSSQGRVGLGAGRGRGRGRGQEVRAARIVLAHPAVAQPQQHVQVAPLAPEEVAREAGAVEEVAREEGMVGSSPG